MSNFSLEGWRVCGHNCVGFQNERSWTREFFLKRITWKPVVWQTNKLIGQLCILCVTSLRKEQQMLCPISTQCKMQTLRGFRHLTSLQMLVSICRNLRPNYLMSIRYLHTLGEESGQKSPVSRRSHRRSWILFYREGAIWLGFITDSHIQSHQHHFSNTISYKWMLLTFPDSKGTACDFHPSEEA